MDLEDMAPRRRQHPLAGCCRGCSSRRGCSAASWPATPATSMPCWRPRGSAACWASRREGERRPSSRRCSAARCPASRAETLEVLLGVFVALVGGHLVPAGGLLVVLLHAQAGLAHRT